jgi:hypothetical protein
MQRVLVPVCVVLLVLVAVSPSPGGTGDFSFSMGYSHLTIDGADPPFNEQDALRFESRISGSPLPELPQLRLGGGLGMSYYYKDYNDGDIVEIGEDVILIEGDSYESLFLLEPEVQVSWRQPLGKHMYVEPGIGVGGVFGNLTAGETFGWFYDEDYDEWSAGFSARPFLRAAYQYKKYAIGLEGSYLWTDLDFDDGPGGDTTELYIGAFFSILY